MNIDFNELIDKLSEVDRPTREAMFCAMKKIYKIAMERNPQEVSRIIDAMLINNYLDYEEAKKIISSIKDSDGKNGGKWSVEDIERFLKTKELPTEELPYYNSYALAVAMNRISSDYGGELKELTDDYALICYNLALCDLKDADRPRWIRNYFSEKLKD